VGFLRAQPDGATVSQAARLEYEGVALPDPQETSGWYLIEALEYWGAYRDGGLGPSDCKHIAEIEGFGHDEAKELRVLSLAFLDGYRRGLNPLGIPPRYEVRADE
jgi:hypothetical protein